MKNFQKVNDGAVSGQTSAKGLQARGYMCVSLWGACSFLDRCPHWCWHVGVAWHMAGSSGKPLPVLLSQMGEITQAEMARYHTGRGSLCLESFDSIDRGCSFYKAGPLAD